MSAGIKLKVELCNLHSKILIKINANIYSVFDLLIISTRAAGSPCHNKECIS